MTLLKLKHEMLKLQEWGYSYLGANLTRAHTHAHTEAEIEEHESPVRTDGDPLKACAADRLERGRGRKRHH